LNNPFVHGVPFPGSRRRRAHRVGRAVSAPSYHRTARRLRIFVPLILFLALAASPLRAQKLPASVTGATLFSPEYIAKLFSSMPRDSARGLLQASYIDQGYLSVRIDIDSARNVVVTEGPRARIVAATIHPDSVARLVASAGLPVSDIAGDYFSTTRLDDQLKRMVTILNDRGFPLAVARLDGFTLNDSGTAVTLSIGVDLGDRVVIREVDVRGNTETDRDLILTAAAIPPNEVFTDALAAQVRSRLVRLNVFSDVEEPELYRTDNGTYGMLITVKEGDANTFDGVLGYQPPATPEETGTVTGLLNFAFRNMFGTGRKFAVRWQKQSKTAQELEVRYGEPFLFRIPLDVELAFRQHQEEATPYLSSYVQRFLSGDFYYGLTDAVSVRLGGSLDETIPEFDSTLSCDQQLNNSRVLSTTVGILYDTRSHPLNPIYGVRYATTYSIGSKLIRARPQCDSAEVGASETRQKIEVDMEGYIPLGRSLVAAGGIHGGEIRGDNLEVSDLFHFGGQSTVRGYRENLILASRRAWSTVELRLLLSGLSYAAVFFDGGYYLRPDDPVGGLTRFEEWIFGYGVGAQIETPIGLARVSFALGKGDTFETGKVYVGLVNQF
jgi:outer membrane protein insertion porin family